MMGNDAAVMSDAEREVIKVLWECGSATVREIREHLDRSGRHWAHTTVNTLLSRLEQKECVACDRSGFAHVFSAAVSREDFMRQQLTHLADDFCDGTRVPLMLALVDGQSFSDDEIDQFRELISELESRRRTKRRRMRKEQRNG